MSRQGRVDVAAMRGGDILADLAERDFTINAMAQPVGGDGLIDPFDGASDLERGRLVAVSERIFADDPLRLMRAVRFCHIFGLRPDTALMWALQDQAPLLSRAAPERVAAEMVSTLEEGRAVDALRLWNDLGLLRVLLPELSQQGRLAPTFALLERLDDLVARPAAWFPAAGALLGDRLARPVDGAVTRPVALKLGGLMHRLSADEALMAARRLKMSVDLGSLLRTVAKVSASLDTRDPWGALAAGLVGSDAAPDASPAGPVGRPAVLFLWEAAPWEPEVICVLAAGARVPEEHADGGGHEGVADAHVLGDLAHHLVPLGRTLTAVDEARRHPALPQPVHLVLHQRDQRRDDHRRPRHRQGRSLVAQRFAAARRQDHHRVATLQHRPDRLLLQGQKALVAPVLA